MFKILCPECHAFQTFFLLELSDDIGHTKFTCGECGHHWRMDWDKSKHAKDGMVHVSVTPIVLPTQMMLFAGC